jgi:116 kDa U5 small nuclear ribonucleoprotein component
MKACDAKDGSLCVHVAKLFNNPSNDGTFGAFARVMSGTVRKGDRVRILGDKYSPLDNEEDMRLGEVSAVELLCGRYRLELNRAPAGSLVVLQGIDTSIIKTATIYSANDALMPYIFRPLVFSTLSVMKIAVEPLVPAELPKMVDGLRKIDKSYPLAITRAEESGEHTIFGTGELYLDCIMHDLRMLFAEIEIKVSDPIVSFCETITETSAIKCSAETANKKNKLTMIAEPLEKGLAEDIEQGRISLEWNQKRRLQFWREKYGWDALAANSIWSFGPEHNGPNMLLNETFPHEVDARLLESVREPVIRGFKWATREGPLCDEPVRNAKFKLLHAVISEEPISRGSS